MATEVIPTVEENITKKLEEKVEEQPPCEDPKPAVEGEPEAVEKSADVELVAKEGEGEAEAAPATPSCEGTPVQTPSFKEESYKVAELKEAERKALEELRAKVEEAIRNKTFLKKKKKVVVAVEEKKEEVEEKKEEKEEEQVKVTEEKKEEVKVIEEEKEEEVKAVEIVETCTEVKEEVIVEEREVKEEAAAVAVEEEAAVVIPQNYHVWGIPILDEAELEIPAKEEGSATEEAPKEEADALKEEAPKEEAEAAKGEADAVVREGEEAAAKEEEEEECKAEVEVEEEVKTSKTDVLLIKFLKARKWKVEEAYNMLRNTIKWRQECEVDALLEQEQDAADEAEFGALAFTHGVDKGGHPVCYNTLGLVEGLANDKARLQRFFRWRLRVMERSVRALDFTPGGTNAILQVIDLQNSAGTLKSISASKHFLALLHDNYPELAAKQIILNVPWWYLPPLYRYLRQQPKVVWAGPTKTTETLFKYISPDLVPVQYGGLSRPNDTDFDGVEAPVHELYVKAGEKREIELPVEESCGGTLVWDVSVLGWDIVYGEEFVPKVYTVIVRKPSKVEAAHKEAIRNSFKAGEPGKLVITIDNTLSKKKKLVVYRYTTKV